MLILVDKKMIEQKKFSAVADLGLDAKRIDAYLKQKISGLEGEPVFQKISGGQSNPTYFINYPERHLVLRKKPSGELLPSAHAVDREALIMSALKDSKVPVPTVLAFNDDTSIAGTPFYVMERVEGRVFSDCWLPGVDSSQRREMFLSMADTLANLHAVNWKDIGLENYGRQGNYFHRQVARWSKQWQLSKTTELPGLEKLAAWLANNVPADTGTAIAHGDFRIGNLIFHPNEPRVVAVLDWELSTLGDPMADLAYSALAWHLLPSEYMGMKGLDLVKMGIPYENEYLDRYYSQAATSARLSRFHYAFCYFRLAVIFEGIASRASSGSSVADKAAHTGKLASSFARLGADLVS